MTMSGNRRMAALYHGRRLDTEIGASSGRRLAAGGVGKAFLASQRVP